MAVFDLWVHRRVARGQAEIRGALEHVQMFRLLRDQRDRLHAGRAGADHANAQAGKIDTFVRPETGVIPLAFERLDPFEIRHAGRGQIAGGHDAEGRAGGDAGIGANGPEAGGGVEFGGRDAGVQDHVAAQIETIRDMFDVAQNFRLIAVAFRPGPFLLQAVVEGVGIFQAFHIAARAGIPVPEPGAADARPGFERARVQAEFSQTVQGVETAQSTADDDGVEVEYGAAGGGGAVDTVWHCGVSFGSRSRIPPRFAVSGKFPGGAGANVMARPGCP